MPDDPTASALADALLPFRDINSIAKLLSPHTLLGVLPFSENK
jgi:hypothetical protein